MLSEWKRTCSLPQSEEVGSVSVWYSCSLVCFRKGLVNQMFVTALEVTSIVLVTAFYLETCHVLVSVFTLVPLLL